MEGVLGAIRSLFKKKKDEEELKAPPPQPIKFPDIGKGIETVKQGASNVIKAIGETPVLQLSPTVPPMFRQNINFGPKIKDVASIGKDILIEAPARVGAETVKTLQGDTKPTDISSFNNQTIARFIYGDEPLRHYGDPDRPGRKFARDIGVPALGTPLVAAGVALDVVPVNPGKAGGKTSIKLADELVTALKKGLGVKAIDLGSDAYEPVKVAWSEAQKILKNFDIDKNLLKNLQSGELIEGPAYVLKKQGDELLINIDKTFKEVVPQIAKTVEKVRGKGVSLTKPVTETTQQIVEEAPKLLPGSTEPLTSKQAKSLFKKTGEAYPFVNKLKPGDQPLIAYEPGVDLAKEQERLNLFSTELESFLDTEFRKNFVAASAKQADDLDDTIRGFIAADPSQKTFLNQAWDNFLGGVGDRTGINNALSTIKNWLRPFTKFNYTDEQLDDVAKRTLLAKFATVDKPWNAYRIAKKEAEELVGRTLNQDELGAVLRKEVQKEAERAKEGITTTIQIGEDVTKKADQLYEIFKPVHEEVAGIVLSYHRLLDDMVNTGKIDSETAKKLRLVNPEDFVKNIDKYIRTTYDTTAQELKNTTLFEPALRDVQLNFSTRFHKMTDHEWGSAYLKALNDNLGYEVSKSSYIPEDLVARVQAGEEGAIADLGRRVKELRGYVYEGDEAFRKTIYNLSENLHDLVILNQVAERPDIFSKIPKEGFVQLSKEKGFGPLAGYWVRSDVAKDLEQDIGFIKNQVTEGITLAKQLIGWWKFGKVPANPKSWFNNWAYATGVQQTFGGNSPLNPFNLKYFLKGYKEFLPGVIDPRKQSKELRAFLENGGFSGTFTDEEVVKFLSDSTADLKTFEEVSQSLTGLGAQVAERFAGQAEKAAKAYGYLDALQKYVFYLHELDRGKTAQEAVMSAHKYINNYALLPQFFRKLRESPASFFVPFMSFVVANTPLMVETLAKRPWRVAAIPTAIWLWNTQWKAQHPDQARDAELQKPYYLQDNPYALIVGYDKGKGEYMYMDLGTLLLQPYRGTLAETAKEFIYVTSGPFVQAGGPLTAVAESIRGSDIYGRPLDQPFGQSTGERILQGLAPLPASLFEVAGVIKSMQGIPYSSSGEVRPVTDSLLRVVGVNLLRGDIETIKKNIDRELFSLNQKQGVYNNVLTNPDASEKARQKAIESFRKDAMETAERIREYMSVGEASNPDALQQLPQAFTEGLLGEIQQAPTQDVTTGTGTPITALQNLNVSGGGKPIKLKGIKGVSASRPSVKGITFNAVQPRRNTKKKQEIDLSVEAPGVSLDIPSTRERRRGVTFRR